MTLFFIVLFAALVFEYINGFHDAANAIATVISTKALTPRRAIMMAAFFNLIGALAGTAVATTIGRGLVDAEVITMVTILSALAAAIVWGLFTWWLGLPSSSSHALVGGLCGAAVASSGNNFGVLHWIETVNGKMSGLLPKIILPMFAAPMLGFFVGATLMLSLYIVLKYFTPYVLNRIFSKLQLLSSSWIAFSHGSNDAQKTMGIISLALFTGTRSNAFDGLPGWLSFLHTPEFEVHFWVMITCALVMAAGTAGGGMRIIKTMGHRMVKLHPPHGFAAEITAAAVIGTASHFGVPLSTTHVISTSIMGVGSTRRLSAVKWGIVSRIVWAWILTLPITGLLGYLCCQALHGVGY